jgi:predicted Zn-dependent peptidase
MGAQGTNAFTSFEQTVYTDDVPASAIDKYLTVHAERFRNPILRIFHTELEAVYEEKNRSLDNDGRKVFETLFASLFQKHNYGLQTTIGTVEHLKNPSLVEIRKYFNTYYVPNNMGIILSGDFNPDTVIATIDRMFGYMQSKPIKKYTFAPEDPIAAPVEKEIVGPDAESLTIGFRLPGNKDKDALLADLVGQVLTNGRAGLLDLNLVKKQKMLRANAFTYALIDHGVLYFSASPTSGQSLEEVKALVLGEIENLKKGKRYWFKKGQRGIGNYERSEQTKARLHNAFKQFRKMTKDNDKLYQTMLIEKYPISLLGGKVQGFTTKKKYHR